jgi:hypothetical protein
MTTVVCGLRRFTRFRGTRFILLYCIACSSEAMLFFIRIQVLFLTTSLRCRSRRTSDV